jgi:hypothetical protein
VPIEEEIEEKKHKLLLNFRVNLIKAIDFSILQTNLTTITFHSRFLEERRKIRSYFNCPLSIGS